MNFNFFTNPNYDLINDYLLNLEQTNVSDELISRIIEIKKYNQNIETIKMVYQLVDRYFEKNTADKFSRNATQIIESKILSGCNDYGLVIASILRRLSIPTIFVQSAHIDWIKDLVNGQEGGNRVRGHIFLEVYIDDQWVLFDATRGTIYFNYDYHNYSLPNGYYVFAKSIDGWQTGCNSLKENNSIMQRLFLNFDVNKYQNPNYKSVSLK